VVQPEVSCARGSRAGHLLGVGDLAEGQRGHCLSAETSTGSINPVDELRQETKLAEQSLPVDSSGG
jgi:hypothetical protein